MKTKLSLKLMHVPHGRKGVCYTRKQNLA